MNRLGSAIELKWNAKDLDSLKATVTTYVSRHLVAVQAGGCLGVFADYLSVQFKWVYVFEPDPDLFVKLTANAPQPNIIRFQAALGFDRRLVRTVCELRPNDGKTVLHEGMTRTEPGGSIPTLRLDDLALDHCDLIYLDIEGDELFALQGAMQTISKCRPIIGCEINRGIEYRGLQEKDVFDFMRANDYENVAKFRSDQIFAPIERRRP